MAEQQSTATIYVVTNTVNGKQYVGQTHLSLHDRWRAHVGAAQHAPYCRILCAAIRKYGAAAFTIQAASVLVGVTQADVDAAETDAIKKFGTLSPDGYNLRSGGGRGRIHAETRALMSAAHMGRQKPRAWRENIRKALTGLKRSAEAIENMRQGRLRNRGWAHSEETKRKLSAAGKGKPQHPNTRAALEAAWAERRAARKAT